MKLENEEMVWEQAGTCMHTRLPSFEHTAFHWWGCRPLRPLGGSHGQPPEE